MKHFLYFLVLAAFFIPAARCQDSLNKQVVYKANVLPSFNKTGRGYLATIKDSSIFLSKTPVPLNFDHINLDLLYRIGYKNIESVRLRQSGSGGKWVAIFGISFTIIGAVIGAQVSKNGDSNDTTGGMAGGILGALIGTTTGFVVAAATEKKFYINGDWKSFQEMKSQLSNK